jgi:membrane associated rhomboid family serine protease
MEKVPFVEPATLSMVLLFWIFQLLSVVIFGGTPILFAVTSSNPSISWVFSAVSHLSFVHIIKNSVGMLILGNAVEKHLKIRYYILAFFSIAIISNVLEWIYRANIHSSESVAGASGAVYAFAGFYLVYAVKENIISYSELPRTGLEYIKYLITSHWGIWIISWVSVLALITLIAELAGIIQPSSTARMAHGSGVILGILLSFSVRKSERE